MYHFISVPKFTITLAPVFRAKCSEFISVQLTRAFCGFRAEKVCMTVSYHVGQRLQATEVAI